MDFKRVHIEDKPIFDAFLNSSSYINDNYAASELNFSNLFCWNISDNISYSIGKDAILIQAVYDDNIIFLPPLVRRDSDFLPAMKAIEQICKKRGIPFVVRSLTKEMKEILERENAGYSTEYNRDYSEYLYDTQDLVSLVGKKYNGKRNHLNYFQNNYDFTFRDYTEKDKQGIVNLVFEWKIATGSSDSKELNAIDNALAYYDHLGLKCCVIELEGEIIAFTMGFVNHNNVGIVLFEKADGNIRGAYPAINHLFASHVLKDCKYINRQEDMGIEGLRKAKLSYYPIGFVDKYDIGLG